MGGVGMFIDIALVLVALAVVVVVYGVRRRRRGRTDAGRVERDTDVRARDDVASMADSDVGEEEEYTGPAGVTIVIPAVGEELELEQDEVPADDEDASEAQAPEDVAEQEDASGDEAFPPPERLHMRLDVVQVHTVDRL
ncbi:MAG: hypothetical protein ACI364_03040 [Coriobacteriales bacterium]